MLAKPYSQKQQLTRSGPEKLRKKPLQPQRKPTPPKKAADAAKQIADAANAANNAANRASNSGSENSAADCNPGKTSHGKQRQAESQTKPDRQVGDPNRVQRQA